MPNLPSSLSHHMRLVVARERGVGAEVLRWIGTDPDLFEAFYRDHVEDVQRFVARRVGDRERAADLTAEIFLAAIDSAHRYRPRRGTLLRFESRLDPQPGGSRKRRSRPSRTV